jgi:tellurite methyltransferase
MSFLDKEYWTKFYSNNIDNKEILEPTSFAKFLINEEYIVNQNNLIELGCGNGRDTIYFSEQGVHVTAIDQCENTTKQLNTIANINSYHADFTRLIQSKNNYDVVYSRFTLHSITDEDEKRTLGWIHNNLNKDGLLCIEARTLQDPICGMGQDMGSNVWFYNEHHRRFIDAGEFVKKLESFGFKIILSEEKNGFAKMGLDNDPVVLRVIARK